MKVGAWHQCGDKSQRLALEQLQLGNGSGVIISPRDLARQRAVEYATDYRSLGAEVIIDQQFYIPVFANNNLSSYPISQHRATLSQLNQISDTSLDSLSSDLEIISREVEVSAVVAPAVIYEAARNDIVQLNARLFRAAKRVGDAMGVPTYATVVLGKSVSSAAQTIAPILSQATALPADGWYFAFEFDADRIPSNREAVVRAAKALMVLACTGRPVLHAFAGPMSLLSLGFGATAAGIAHPQNTWQFVPDRWQPPSGSGGGGDAPPRFFSSALWGTLIYPDETARLPASVLGRVLTLSPFSGPVAQNPQQPWNKWDANKHLVFLIGKAVAALVALPDARSRALEAQRILAEAIALHGTIAGSGLQLGDATNSYQANWRSAVATMLTDAVSDYDFLELLP